MAETIDRTARRLAALYTADRILATSPTIEDAATKILAALGESEGWLVGQMWLVDDRHNVLRYAGGWHAAHRDFAEFIAQSRAMIVPRDHGVLGQVWASGTPTWIHDVAEEPGFVRAESARKEGLHGGLVVPIWNMDHVVGVIEYYGPQARIPNEGRMALVSSVSQELGLFVEHKRVQEALRRSSSILKAQQEASLDGILVVDENQAVVSRNSRFCEMWGVPPAVMDMLDDKLLQAHIRTLVVDPDAHMARVAALYKQPLEIGHDEIKLNDGRVFHRYSAPAITPNGMYYGRVWYFRDVTEARRAEASLARLAAIVEASSDAILSQTLEGLVTSWNPGAQRMFGYEEAEVVGRAVSELVPAEQQPELTEMLARVGRGEHVEHHETAWQRKNGTRVEVSVAVSPIKDAAGTITGAAVIARDITEINRLRLELQAQFEQLIELDRLKNIFVNAVTHELRTPLTAMKGYLEFLEEGVGGTLTPKELEFVAEVRKGEERMERLVADLLDYARIEAGTFKLNCESADFAAKVHDVSDSLMPLATSAKVHLEVMLPAEPLMVEMDPQRIGQVLINLVGNALKFTQEGGTVTIRASAKGESVRCDVVDTGVGIAAEDLPKLFQRFVQLDQGARKGGTGLGLSISKAMIDAHNGQIGALSEVGKGSTFWFEIPRQSAACPRPAGV